MTTEFRTTPEFVGTDVRENEPHLEQKQAAPRTTSESWLDPSQIDELQSRWNLIQQEFVDEPHTSVKQAEALVAETMDKVARMLSEQQSSLNGSVDGREDISTEDLRIALQRYRTFFNRLLAM